MISSGQGIVADVTLALIYFGITILAYAWKTSLRIVGPVVTTVQWPFSMAYKISSWVMSAIMLPLVYFGGVAAMVGVFSGLILGSLAVKLGLGKPTRSLPRSHHSRGELYNSAFSSGLCTPNDIPQLFYHTPLHAESDDMEFEEPKEDAKEYVEPANPDLLEACAPPQFRCRSYPQHIANASLTSATTVIPLSKSLDPMEADYLVFYEDSDSGYQTPRRETYQPSEGTIVEEEE